MNNFDAYKCLFTVLKSQRKSIKPPNRIKAHPIIEAQSQGYNFADILEAHPNPNKNKTDNFKKI